ncbi:MAG: hypothetical protein JWO30_4321 [Fibrobacteres bacterium]|nr:hypothetical protein [Fibrobacterota bacterium]
MRSLLRMAMLSISIAFGGALAADTFKFQDAAGDLDLLYGDKPVYRLMTRYDGKDSTKKVFHHVYGFHGEGFITKGAGRLWGHHRGIWLGWSDVTSQGKTDNFWECPDGNHQSHNRYLPEREAANGVFARRASQTDWIDAAGTLMGQDIREVTAWFPADGMLALDFAAQVISPKGEMTVKATPAHGGLQFRSDSQDDTATAILPKDAVLQPADVIAVKDSNSWVFESFNVKTSRYGVLAMDHPASPRPTKQNFKGYGRIGAYYGDKGAVITPETPMKIWERFLVFDMAKYPKLDQAALQGYYDAYRKSPPAATLPTATSALLDWNRGKPDMGAARARVLVWSQGNLKATYGEWRGLVGVDGKRMMPGLRAFAGVAAVAP